MTQPRKMILLSGMIAADPGQGGATWAVLQYLMGFQRLGHDVLFVEPIRPSTVRPIGSPLDRSANADYFRKVTERFGLASSSALLLEGTRQTAGLPYDRLFQAVRRANVLINISGMLTDEDLTQHIPVRAYLDLDPAFNQFWHAASGIDMRFAGHTHFVTIGLALGTPGCPVPTCGLDWITTPQPVVLEHWPVAAFAHDALTTVGNWRGYGSVQHQGVFYGQKAHSWRPLVRLPTLTAERFAPALAIDPGETNDLKVLRENGWVLLDPPEVAATPDDYRRFIQGSKAEFGVAKSGYVASRCGWFSDRSVCYLASGRPVIAQETGFSRYVPTGEGLFAFETVDDVLAAIDEMNRDYPRHSRAAREIAEAHFDSDMVLRRLLDLVTGE
jgi:hypothetical protein